MIKKLVLLSFAWVTATNATILDRVFPADNGRYYFSMTPKRGVRLVSEDVPPLLRRDLEAVRQWARQIFKVPGDPAPVGRLRTMLGFGYPFSIPSIADSSSHLISMMELAVRTFDLNLVRDVVEAQGAGTFRAVDIVRVLNEEIELHQYVVDRGGPGHGPKVASDPNLPQRQFEVLTRYEVALRLDEPERRAAVLSFAQVTRNQELLTWFKPANCDGNFALAN